MVSDLIVDVGLGVYLGLLAGIFPAVVAFALGFSFKYLTGVSIPGLGVVVLAGALAGISGGLLGLLDEEVAQSAAGITAFLVVLMLSLWAHAQGDKLGANVPRNLTLSRLRRADFSTEFLARVDSYGQIRIEPVGPVEDIEGFPPLSDETREAIRTSAWKFPVGLSIPELEARVAEKLAEAHSLTEVNVSIDSEGGAEISAAPETAGLSRRIPSGKRAVSIRTLLPTGLAIGDRVTLHLAEESVTGEVVSARTDGADEQKPSNPPAADPPAETDGGTEAETTERAPHAPTTTGGMGSVTVALAAEQARRVVREDVAKLTVQSRGKNRAYESLDVLERGDNQLQLVTVGPDSAYAGRTLEAANFREQFGVGVLALRRKTERTVAPRPGTQLAAGDELVVAGKGGAIRSLREAVA